VDRLSKLVNDLLDTTRLVEGKMLLYPQQFDLLDLVTEKIEDIRQITIQHEFNVNCTEAMVIVADRERIGQVLINLLSNAVKYSPQGGEVLIECKKAEDSVKICVKDNGIGISRDLVGRVFDRFFRVGGAVMNTYPGMGLGLYISAQIIHRHGGTISVESEEGKGSLFYFTLPVN
jgi:signal transduction histidine kinase